MKKAKTYFILRKTAAIFVLVLLTLTLLGFAVKSVILAKIQLFPAILALPALFLLFPVLLTLLTGRLFCGVFCPLGTLQDMVSRKKKFFYEVPWFIPTAIAALCAVLIICGFAGIAGLIEPYAIFGRFVSLVLRPATAALNTAVTSVIPGWKLHVTAPVGELLPLIVSLCIFAAILVAARLKPRFFCRFLCPSGVIFSFFARFSLFKIHLNEEKCISCGKCEQKCASGCIKTKEKKLNFSQCVMCAACFDDCPTKALSFKSAFFSPAVKKNKPNIDEKRREILEGFVKGFVFTAAATAPLLKQKTVTSNTSALTDKIEEARLVPPGADSYYQIKSRCVSCGLCVSGCPTNALELRGQTACLSLERGYCDFECNSCGKLCPAGAIRELPLDEKKQTQIGECSFILENCVVYKDGTACAACAEHCPTRTIKMKPFKGDVGIPSIDTSLCIGCGQCYYVCPAKPKALRITPLTHRKKALPDSQGQYEVQSDVFSF